MRSALPRGVLVAALVVAVVLLVGSVGATVAWVHGGGDVGTSFEFFRPGERDGNGDDGRQPDERRVLPPWREQQEQPAPSSPSPAEPEPLPSQQSPAVPGLPIPIPTAPTR